MNRETIPPDNHKHWLELRSQDLTSTDVAALFDLSPYTTKSEVWYVKKNKSVSSLEDNERLFWGDKLEPAIAQGIAERQGWHIKPFKDYMRLPDLRIGSSFDFRSDDFILEIKNVDGLIFKDGWEIDDEGNAEAPHHIELQVQHQMLVSGLKKAYIGALVGGNKLTLIEREADEEIHKAILDKAASFWKSIDDNEPPEFNFEKDADFIRGLYGHAEPNKIHEPNEHIDELMKKYQAFHDAEKAASKHKDAIKAEMLTIMGDAEKCRGEFYSINAGIVAESSVAYTRKAYRNFKITFRKPKGEKK